MTKLYMISQQTEDLIKFIWIERLYNKTHLTTTTNKQVTVYSTGSISNEDNQPFLYNAEIAIDGTIFSGEIAINYYSSDWHSKHYKNLSNIILHIVTNCDSVICKANGDPIPTLVININPEVEQVYQQITSQASSCGCAETFMALEPINQYSILTRMAVERLENKYSDFLKIHSSVGNNWNEAFYIMLFRYIEMGQNKEAFMRLAHIVPYNIVCRVRDNIKSVEALLLGSAGFLYARAEDDYTLQLQQEFDHLQRRFNIEPMRNSEWSTKRIMPNNHPIRRIVELSSLLCSQDLIFSKLADCRTLSSLKSILNVSASEYWSTHHYPGLESPFSVKSIGSEAIHILGINLVATMLFVKGQQNTDDSLKESAIEILEQFHAESNKYTKLWKNKGIKIENAFFSQAIIQLTKKYCLNLQCTECSIGKIRLINAAANKSNEKECVQAILY